MKMYSILKCAILVQKIADKITSVSKKSSVENSATSHSDDEIEVPKKRYIFPEESQQIIDKLRLV